MKTVSKHGLRAAFVCLFILSPFATAVPVAYKYTGQVAGEVVPLVPGPGVDTAENLGLPRISTNGEAVSLNFIFNSLTPLGAGPGIELGIPALDPYGLFSLYFGAMGASDGALGADSFNSSGGNALVGNSELGGPPGADDPFDGVFLTVAFGAVGDSVFSRGDFELTSGTLFHTGFPDMLADEGLPQNLNSVNGFGWGFNLTFQNAQGEQRIVQSFQGVLRQAPEPASFALMLLGLGAVRRLRR